MMMHSVDVYRGLAAESELDPGWVECGGIRLASSEERMEELRRQAGWAKTFGLPLELISAEEAKREVPADVHRRACSAPPGCPPTATSTPRSSPTRSPTSPAARASCEVFQNTRVTGIEVERGRVRAVETERGRIEAEVVVNAGGMYAAEIGRMAGVRVPLIPMSSPVPGHAAVSRARRRRPAADPARPRPADLLPRGRRRPGDGRLRARQRSRPSSPTAPAASTRSRPTSTAACSRTTGTGSPRSPRTRSAGSR